MQIYHYNKEEKVPCGDCVLALGLFDGIHIAHRDLISSAQMVAKKNNIPCGVFTFVDDSMLKPDAPRLYSNKEKIPIIIGIF